MQPPVGASGELLQPADALDVPVFLRRSNPLRPLRRPHPRRINEATLPWPAMSTPPDGAYLVRTTWREIIDAATTVGRDPTGWLAAVPSLAWAEFVARRSPLIAYLGRSAHSNDGAVERYHLEPNVVYEHGTEASAQVGFGYRMGMTMAEWTCRGLLRLGPTSHAECAPPADAGAGWTIEAGLPDLVAYRAATRYPWLIEAKGGRRLGLNVLRKGAAQLTRNDLMDGPHVQVLCGTSLEPRVS